jgi:hypothetical protein
MELQLKHLAPYLPYQVKGRSKTTGTVFTITGFNDRKDITTFGGLGMSKFESTQLLLKPILQLSDLVETEFLNYHAGTEHNKEIINLFCLEFTHSEEKLINLDLTTLPYQCAEYIFKNGYDFFGLIDSGLAIDINTIIALDIKKL